MISRYEAYMDGNALSEVNENLLILDIQHQAPSRSISASTIANRQGNIVLNDVMSGASVTILFALRIYSIADRQEALQDVQAWANGAVLETNDRDGQRLFVRCTEYPMISSALNWTDTIEMTFTAFERPFWEDDTATEETLAQGTSGEGTLEVGGNVTGAFVEVYATAKAAVSSASFTVNGKTISLTGLSMQNGQILSIAYDGKGMQSIKVGTTSVLSKRTGADDLISVIGDNTISFESSANMSVKFSVRGLWL